jgi:signal transduction histidine kinase
VLSEARILAGRGGVGIESRLRDHGCTVLGDAERLTQAFLIVLDNAVKFSDPGTTVSVGLRCGDGETVLEVRNTGPEIPPADLPFVFNRFYRGRQATGSPTTGSGLGLSIANWIVATHGGKIEV